MTKIRKLLALLCALVLLCGMVPAMAAAEGEIVAENQEIIKTTRFSEGYVRLAAGTKVYASASTKKEKGTVTAASYVYAKLKKQNAKDANKDWLEIRFDTKGGEKVKAYVQMKSVKTLSAKKQKSLQKELKKQNARKVSGNLIPVAEYTAVKKVKSNDGEVPEDTELAVNNVKLTKKSTEERVKVSWSKVSGVKYYRVYYKKGGSSKYTYKKVAASKTSVTIPVTGAKKNLVYVKAYLKNGRTAKSSTKAITPYWYKAYLVGESAYPSYVGNVLRSPNYDIPAFKAVFTKQKAQVKVNMNVNKSTILSGIRSFLGSAKKSTICVFVFIGHGVVKSGDDWAGTLCTTAGEYIKPGELKSYMDSNIKSNHVVLLLGSCGSGAFIHHTWEAGVSTEEEAAAAAETAKQEAAAMNRAFTSAFVSAFKRGASSNAGEFKTSSKKYTVIAGAEVDQSGWERYWYYGSPDNTFNARNIPMHGVIMSAGYEYCDANSPSASPRWVSSYKSAADTSGDKKISVQEAYYYARKQVYNGNPNDVSDMQFWSNDPGLILFP